MNRANQATGPNAGGLLLFTIPTPLAARVGQFRRSTKKLLMKRTITFMALALLSGRPMVVGDEAIHQDWIEKDRDFVQAVNAAIQNDPEHVDRILFWFPVERKDLGFGYSLTERYVGKGYMGFSCQMLYLQDKLVSFCVTPSMGLAKELTPIYVEMLGDCFKLNPDGKFEPFCYRPEAATSVLPGFDAEVKMSAAAQRFCSPFSGILYGTTGGYGGGYLANRKAYFDVISEIDSALCLRLLYSINPATRLTAYEHYRQHEADLKDIKEQVEVRIRKVLQETPRVGTMDGCFFKQEASDKVLESIIGQSLRGKVEPSAPANGSQPIRSETNRPSSAAGSRR